MPSVPSWKNAIAAWSDSIPEAIASTASTTLKYKANPASQPSTAGEACDGEKAKDFNGVESVEPQNEQAPLLCEFFNGYAPFLMVKATELIVQLRPRALWRLLYYRDSARRRAYRWCFRNGGFVWLAELFEFFFQCSRLQEKRSLADHAGAQLSFEAPLISSRSAGAMARLPYQDVISSDE